MTVDGHRAGTLRRIDHLHPMGRRGGRRDDREGIRSRLRVGRRG
jgi:hypothetical protein